MDHFAQAVDALDAAVHSGDSLWQEKNRALLKERIESWGRAIDSFKQMAEEEGDEANDGAH